MTEDRRRVNVGVDREWTKDDISAEMDRTVKLDQEDVRNLAKDPTEK